VIVQSAAIKVLSKGYAKAAGSGALADDISRLALCMKLFVVAKMEAKRPGGAVVFSSLIVAPVEKHVIPGMILSVPPTYEGKPRPTLWLLGQGVVQSYLS
jgi:hypothetical protein